MTTTLSGRSRVPPPAFETEPPADPYAHLDAAERFIHLTRDRAFLALLHRYGLADLSTLRILEIGCGEGALLRSLLHYGARPEYLTGIDIDARRLGRARALLPAVSLLEGDARRLPYADGSFDLGLAFTLLTSALPVEDRRRIAEEALRILRPGGLLVVYDFWVNPLNPRVRPLSAGELTRLFVPRAVEIERVTPAPPLVRALARWPRACRLLERVPLLRTHYLAAIVKESSHEP